MEGIGGEISSKIRAAIKTKLMEMGAYVDEELPDYVMVMVANKRSKAQMTDDLQLFLGKSTEQFTNWLQQVLNKLQEVATVNNKALTDTKKVQSRSLSSDEAAHKAKSASKLKCEQVAKPRPEHLAERAAGHRSDKKHTAGDGRDRRVGGSWASTGKTERAAGTKAPEAASSKTKIILMNTDDEEEDEEEDFINIKADAEAEALLKAELPASARQLLAAAATATAGAARPPAETAAPCDPAATAAAPGVTAALAHSTSGTQKARPAARRVVTAPASTVAVAPKRSAPGEGGGSSAKKAAANPPRKSVASTVAIADRLGVRASAAPSIKDRLGTRAASTDPPAVYSRLAGRLGARNPAATAADGPAAEAAASADSRVQPTRARVADRLGTRREDAAARKRPAEGARGAGGDGAEVTAKRPAAEGGSGSSSGSRLAQRLRELAEGSGARVAHVPPNNIRQVAADRRPSIISQVVPAGVRSGEGEESPSVALPSVVRVTPRPRLPARLQANKNLLLKAVAEAQRSVAAAAASAPGSGVVTAASRWRGRSRQAVEAPPQEEEEAGEREEEEQQGEEGGEEAPQAPAGHFTLGLLTRENFAVTVPNESGATGDLDAAEAEERSDDVVGRVRISRGLRDSGKRRLVVTAPSEAQAATADAPQQITIRLSPDNSCDGDSSSEREEEEAAEVPSLPVAGKDDERRYAGLPASEEQYEEEEDEEEGPAAAVAAVRPTVVTTTPHMDVEPVTRTNPQFVVTLDGVDVSSFPNGGADDEECPVDSGRATDRDLSKAESGGSGAGQSAAAGVPATGKATVVQRVEPRLRLGPMPTAAQRRQEAAAEAALAGVSSGSGSAPGKAERCKYWPACRLGAKCAFHHPTQTCRAFPACKFGEKCLYIHPNCKFDAACTRRDCPYTHSSPRLSAAAARGPAQPGSAAAAVCRFFPGCTNPACRFLHPKACKYGRYCVKTGCTFQHDEVPTTDKLKWVCPFKA